MTVARRHQESRVIAYPRFHRSMYCSLSVNAPTIRPLHRSGHSRLTSENPSADMTDVQEKPR